MQRRSVLTPVCLMALLPCCVSLEGGTVAAAGGIRTLGEREFESLDSPPYYGIEAVAHPTEFPLDVELGFYHHREDRTLAVTGDTEVSGSELALGVRKTFRVEELSLHPYLGFGVSAFYTDRDNEISPIVGREGSDFDTGFHARAGVDWFPRDHLFLGVDARWVQENDFEYGGYDLDGAAFTLHVGWAF